MGLGGIRLGGIELERVGLGETLKTDWPKPELLMASD